MSTVQFFSISPEEGYCEKEVLRYSGCKGGDSELCQLIKDCYTELKDKLTYRLCYRKLKLKITDDICDFDLFSVRSQNLAKALEGCGNAIIFAATIGVDTDRLIAKYNRISPAKALMLQALGAERVEALCDEFCRNLGEDHKVRPRFSPGYGDLSLEVQRDVFAVLKCEKHIGLTLNDSLLMSPSKSVTAFVGVY